MVRALFSGSSRPGLSPGGDVMFCSSARQFTFTVSLSTQVCKRGLANLMLGLTLRWASITSRAGGLEILLIARSHGNRDKLHWGTLSGGICRLYISYLDMSAAWSK